MSDGAGTPGGSGDAGAAGGTGGATTDNSGAGSTGGVLSVEQIEQAATGRDAVTGGSDTGSQAGTTGTTTTGGPPAGTTGTVRPAGLLPASATTATGGGTASGGTASGGTGSGGTGSGGTGSGGTAAGSGGGQVSEEFEALPPWAQKRIRGLEKENGDNRVRAKTAEEKADERVKENADKLQGFLDGFANVMGLTQEPDERPKTIDEAMRRIEAGDGLVQQWMDKYRQLQVREAVWQTAADQGANTRELIDSASFLAKLEGLDPAAGDFGDKLSGLIAAQVESNPTRFKVAPLAAPPKQSGGEFTGGPGGRPNDAEMSIEDHIRQIDPVSAARR